jgi:hypothetical protein
LGDLFVEGEMVTLRRGGAKKRREEEKKRGTEGRGTEGRGVRFFPPQRVKHHD